MASLTRNGKIRQIAVDPWGRLLTVLCTYPRYIYSISLDNSGRLVKKDRNKLCTTEKEKFAC